MTPDGTSAPAPMDGALLLSLARSAIAEHFGGPKLQLPAGAAWLEAPRGVFCSLHTRGGDLRGCVGQVHPRFPLHEAVRHAARAAAFQDTRFSPVSEAELPNLRIDVSVLSPLERMQCQTEAEFLREVRPGVDGVVLTHGFHAGLFIPQMWEQLPHAEQFLFHLKRKAGLPPSWHWQPDVKVERFTVVHWEEA